MTPERKQEIAAKIMSVVSGQPLAVFYAVRNSNGQYYRSYSSNGRRGWKDKLTDAKVYVKIGPARGMATSLNADVVEFIVTEVNVLDESARRAEKERKSLEFAARKEIVRKEQEVKAAQDELFKAQEKLNRLMKENSK